MHSKIRKFNNRQLFGVMCLWFCKYSWRKFYLQNFSQKASLTPITIPLLWYWRSGCFKQIYQVLKAVVCIARNLKSCGDTIVFRNVSQIVCRNFATPNGGQMRNDKVYVYLKKYYIYLIQISFSVLCKTAKLLKLSCKLYLNNIDITNPITINETSMIHTFIDKPNEYYFVWLL